MIEVVGVLVATCNGQHACAQDVGDAVRHEQWIAWVGDQPSKTISQADATLGGGQQHDATIGGDPAAIKGGREFLAADGWKCERRDRIVGHGGWGSA